ncbi:MAG: CoA protein activase [Clostridiales bacterium]|nr:CoA protein activase [Clostridiales bacterium]
MILTFPHMGNMYIAAKAFLDDIGIKTVVPPPVTKRTLELGTKYSPELICLPFKINLGNYIESIEMGANTILITGSCGPCRFGLYGMVQEEILRDMGYDVDVLIFDPPRESPAKLFESLSKLRTGKGTRVVLRSISKIGALVKGCDNLYELAIYKRAREQIKGETDSILNEFEKDVRTVFGIDETLHLFKKYKSKFEQIAEVEGCAPLNVGLVGEIYTLIEPYVNLNIEKRLGQLGVHVDRSMTVSGWVNTHLLPNLLARSKERQMLREAKPYLDMCIGGHAWQTVGHSMDYIKNSYDGIIQIMPFGCMPEIVVQSILPSISKEEGIPIMTLTVDELTGTSGYGTRLEAFVETIAQRRVQ